MRSVLLIVALAALAGCPLTHDDPEPTKCRAIADCFGGEWCDFSGDPQGIMGECRPRLDSGILDKGPPRPDLPPPDAFAGDAGDAGDAAPAPDGDLGPAVELGVGDLGSMEMGGAQ